MFLHYFLNIKLLDFWLQSQNVMGYFIFNFTQIELFTALYPTLSIKKMFTKNPLHFYSLKATQFYSDSVKKNYYQGGGAPPPSACLKIKLPKVVYKGGGTLWVNSSALIKGSYDFCQHMCFECKSVIMQQWAILLIFYDQRFKKFLDR